MNLMTNIDKQTTKFNSANPIVKKLVENDVRKKIGVLAQQMNLMLIQMQSLYVQPPSFQDVNES